MPGHGRGRLERDVLSPVPVGRGRIARQTDGGPAMTGEALGWYASIFAWLFFTGIGIPPCPEEAGILYAASVHALHPDVWWPFAWMACGLGILAADCVLYG